MKKSLRALVISIAAGSAFSAHADINIDKEVKSVEKKVIEWRRDIHQHPELSNRETRTAAIVAKHLKSLGMQVETDIAHAQKCSRC